MNEYVKNEWMNKWINKLRNMCIKFKWMNKWINYLYEQTNKWMKRKYNTLQVTENWKNGTNNF